MAQRPKSTEYDGMPTSAIAIGLVDYVLPPAEMPAQLIAYVSHAFGKTSLPVAPPPPKSEDTLKKIFLLRAKTNGDFTAVNLTVQPVPAGPDSDVAAKLFLVVFEDAPALGPQLSETAAVLDAGGEASENTTDVDARVATLKQELRSKEEYLRTAKEELATSNEELKSANEEMQSVNEELATVNTERQDKVADLSRSNNDMNNLLEGTGIGTIFVDYQLRIQRFTPAVTQVINLILTDVGRPVGHIVSNLLGYDSLVADVRAVLDSLVPKEVEVQTQDLGLPSNAMPKADPPQTAHFALESG